MIPEPYRREERGDLRFAFVAAPAGTVPTGVPGVIVFGAGFGERWVLMAEPHVDRWCVIANLVDIPDEEAMDVVLGDDSERLREANRRAVRVFGVRWDELEWSVLIGQYVHALHMDGFLWQDLLDVPEDKLGLMVRWNHREVGVVPALLQCCAAYRSDVGGSTGARWGAQGGCEDDG